MSDSQPAPARLGGLSSRTVVTASTFALLALACAGTAILASSGSTLGTPPPAAGTAARTGTEGPRLVVVDGPAGAWATAATQPATVSQATITSGPTDAQAVLIPAAQTSQPAGATPAAGRRPTSLLPVLPGSVSSAGTLPPLQVLPPSGVPASPTGLPVPVAPPPSQPPPSSPPAPEPTHPGPPPPTRPPAGGGAGEKPGTPGHPLPPIRPRPSKGDRAEAVERRAGDSVEGKDEHERHQPARGDRDCDGEVTQDREARHHHSH